MKKMTSELFSQDICHMFRLDAHKKIFSEAV